MRSARFRRLLAYEWDVVAGAAAAVGAILLSHLGRVTEDTVRAVILLLVAMALLRGMRTEAHVHLNAETLDVVRRHVYDIEDKVGGTDVVVIPPPRIRQEFREFSSRIHGEVIWYNACCRMFHRQEVFDATLRPLVDNPDVTTIRLICSPRERQAWAADVAGKVQHCGGDGKVPVPTWGTLPPATSFLIGDLRTEHQRQALVVVMEEPFAAVGHGLSVPRYVLRVQNHSELLPRMDEVARAAISAFEAAAERAEPEPDAAPTRGG